MEEAPVFRAAKKRKFIRSRDHQTEDDVGASKHQPEQLAEITADNGGEEVNIPNLLKLRKQNRLRGTGVQFSQQKRVENDGDESNKSMALATINPAEERLKDISNRFVGSTGHVVDVDKHMVAYIDSELAKRQNAPLTTSSTPGKYTNHADPLPLTNNEHSSQQLPSQNPPQTQSQPQHPSQPQLAEFDLGPSVHTTNLLRTSAALARAHSGLPEPETEPPSRRRRPRLGRDGKPLRPRPRKRRDSASLARDALVEQVLHEHKVDVFETEHTDPEGEGEGADDADEKLAQQFRQNFMDAVAERQQRSQKTATKTKAAEPSGPKLGGGRSARAKMALMQQQQQKK